MRNWFGDLEWQSFKDLVDSKTFTELDNYADYTFANGVMIRISTGKMAHTNAIYPYEMMVKKPCKDQYSIPRLNTRGVTATMDRLSQEDFEV